MINKFANYLADLTLKRAKTKKSACIYEGFVSLFVNLFIFLIKIVAGLLIHSIALISDAFHSLSDSLSSIVIVIGSFLSSKPADKEHPFGHARSENITALIVSIMLFIISFEFIKDSIFRLLNPQKVEFSIPVIILIVATILIKDLLAKYAFILAGKVGSIALESDGFHHKSDVYATSLVIVSLIASKFEFYLIDAIIGFIISLYIGVIAFRLAKKSIDPILGLFI